MGLTLIIARHAKSDWHAGARTDHERPLNGRGLRQAPLLAQQLRDSGHLPTLLLCSDARRTEETALLMESTLGNPTIQYLHGLYLGSLSDIKHAVVGHGADNESIMVLGHNPGFSHAASMLSGTGVELKTACAAVLRTDCEDFETAFTSRDFELVQLFEGRQSSTGESE